MSAFTIPICSNSKLDGTVPMISTSAGATGCEKPLEVFVTVTVEQPIAAAHNRTDSINFIFIYLYFIAVTKACFPVSP